MDIVYALRPLMWFAINFIIVPGQLVSSSFLISVCMFIVSKALLISSAHRSNLVEPLSHGVV